MWEKFSQEQSGSQDRFFAILATWGFQIQIPNWTSTPCVGRAYTKGWGLKFLGPNIEGSCARRNNQRVDKQNFAWKR